MYYYNYNTTNYEGWLSLLMLANRQVTVLKHGVSM